MNTFIFRVVKSFNILGFWDIDPCAVKISDWKNSSNTGSTFVLVLSDMFSMASFLRKLKHSVGARPHIASTEIPVKIMKQNYICFTLFCNFFSHSIIIVCNILIIKSWLILYFPRLPRIIIGQWGLQLLSLKPLRRCLIPE